MDRFVPLMPPASLEARADNATLIAFIPRAGLSGR